MEFWMMLSESQVPNKEHVVAMDVVVAGSKLLNTHYVLYVCFTHLFISNFFLLRQSLAIWPWLVWYLLHKLGWSWIFDNSALNFCNQLHKHFICSSQWYYKIGALFCQCNNSNRKGKHEFFIPFVVDNRRTRFQTKHQITGLIAQPSQQGLVIWNKVTGPRNRTMWPKAGGWGILLREGSTHEDWPFSSVLRGCGRRIRLFLIIIF